VPTRQDGPARDPYRREPRSARDPILVAGFFVTGMYGGFLQAGVGFLVLAMTTIALLDLARGNALKVFAVMRLSLAVFAGAGHVDWPAGLVLGLGDILGVGVRVAVRHGHQWLERAVTATVVVFAVLLWVT
jgi:uncharacterized protein